MPRAAFATNIAQLAETAHYFHMVHWESHEGPNSKVSAVSAEEDDAALSEDERSRKKYAIRKVSPTPRGCLFLAVTGIKRGSNVAQVHPRNIGPPTLE